MNDLPEPLTPPNCDLSDFPRMMIDILRLRQSSFDAILNDAAWRAGINLWMSSFHSVPAGSLDNDPGALTKAAGLGRDLRTWEAVKEDALRGFVLCSDGRLYHSTVCEVALEAWIEKLVQRLSSGAGNAKRWKTEFDPAPIEADLARAGDLLAALAPDSKSLIKTRRRASQSDTNGTPARNADAIPSGQKTDPTGTDKRSRRDQENVPSGSPAGSQEKGREEKGYKEPPLPPAPPAPPAPNPRVTRIMHAGGFITPPTDLPLVSSWIEAGADFDKDIIPTLERVRDEVRGRNGRAPFRLKLFENEIRTLLAEREAEERRWREGADRIRQQDQRQAEEQAAEETPAQAEERQRRYRESLAAQQVEAPG